MENFKQRFEIDLIPTENGTAYQFFSNSAPQNAQNNQFEGFLGVFGHSVVRDSGKLVGSANFMLAFPVCTMLNQSGFVCDNFQK